MNKITLQLPDKYYPVYIERTGIEKLFEYIRKNKLNKNLFFVIDENVYKIYKELLLTLFNSYPNKISYKTIKATESRKSLKSVEALYYPLMENNFGRDTLLIALGGGIIGDVAGYAAATYMRGIQLLQIPTTLLAAVDSSVGGKTGVNFNHSKNIIGSFYQPEMVLIDTQFFSSLPRREVLCGVGEILKYAFISSKSFCNYFTKNINKLFLLDDEVVRNIVNETVQFKSSVVIEDEKERGLRKILNFGHTFAHAIEAEQKHRLKHGEAVILGIVCALFLSCKLHLINQHKLEEFLNIVKPLKKKIKMKNIEPVHVFKNMNADKKNRQGKIQFVLIKEIGEILLDVEADRKDVVNSIEEALIFFGMSSRAKNII